MYQYLTELSWFSVLLLIGIIVTILANKLKIPNVLFLIIVGMVAGYFKEIKFDPTFLAMFATFALIMIIFEGTSRFKPKEISSISPLASKLAFIFLLLSLISLTITLHLIFRSPFTLKAFLVSGLFASLMSGTSPETTLSLLKKAKNKMAKILEFESILNTPLMVIIPLIILQIYKGQFTLVPQDLLTAFLQNIMTGIGTGVVIGLIVYRIMKYSYSELISPLILIATALITYTLAEFLGGSGILAVTALGVLHGIMLIKGKEAMGKFSDAFTEFLKITVFILLGLVIKVPFKDRFFLVSSLILFCVYVLFRYLSVTLSLINTDFTAKQKIFMSLNAPKGVAVAVVAFIISSETVQLTELIPILNLTFLFILYSIILATITSKLFYKTLKS